MNYVKHDPPSAFNAYFSARHFTCKLQVKQKLLALTYESPSIQSEKAKPYIFLSSRASHVSMWLIIFHTVSLKYLSKKTTYLKPLVKFLKKTNHSKIQKAL